MRTIFLAISILISIGLSAQIPKTEIFREFQEVLDSYIEKAGLEGKRIVVFVNVDSIHWVSPNSSNPNYQRIDLSQKMEEKLSIFSGIITHKIAFGTQEYIPETFGYYLDNLILIYTNLSFLVEYKKKDIAIFRKEIAEFLSPSALINFAPSMKFLYIDGVVTLMALE